MSKPVVKIEPVSPNEIKKNRKLRVAAYCRVSTKSYEQGLSYESQKEYYERYIQSHEDWELVGIYSDKGITGTGGKTRTGFERLLADCQEKSNES